MSRTYFNADPKTFVACIPVDWQSGSPVPLLVPATQYPQILPGVPKEHLAIEEFTWIMWTFAMESRMREDATKTSQFDGSRYVDMAALRELKVRYLLKAWTLKNADGSVEMLERHTTKDASS